MVVGCFGHIPSWPLNPTTNHKPSKHDEKTNSFRKATNKTTPVEHHRDSSRFVAPRLPLLVLALEDCVTCHEHSRSFLIEAWRWSGASRVHAVTKCALAPSPNPYPNNALAMFSLPLILAIVWYTFSDCAMNPLIETNTYGCVAVRGTPVMIPGVDQRRAPPGWMSVIWASEKRWDLERNIAWCIVWHIACNT